jgi:hypothetical protein
MLKARLVAGLRFQNGCDRSVLPDELDGDFHLLAGEADGQIDDHHGRGIGVSDSAIGVVQRIRSR